MATPVSGQEYEAILAWTQLLATLQMLKMEISYVIKKLFSPTKLVFSRLLSQYRSAVLSFVMLTYSPCVCFSRVAILYCNSTRVLDLPIKLLVWWQRTVEFTSKSSFKEPVNQSRQLW